MDIKQYVSDKERKARTASRALANNSTEIKNTALPDDNTPYKKVNSLIGVVTSGISNLGSAHHEHIVRKIKSLHVK